MTTATSQGEAHEVAKENKKAIQARNLRTGVLFTAPALIILAIFVFYPAIQTFITGVDSAAVMVNASTRFTDGAEFGFGAEIGISTQKLHARGPMGLAELTSTTYVVTGDGHVRG